MSASYSWERKSHGCQPIQKSLKFCSETEILDIAPVDMFNGISKQNLQDWPAEIIDPRLKEEALDIKIHWVNQTGKPAKLTAGLTLQPTVHTRSFRAS